MFKCLLFSGTCSIISCRTLLILLTDNFVEIYVKSWSHKEAIPCSTLSYETKQSCTSKSKIARPRIHSNFKNYFVQLPIKKYNTIHVPETKTEAQTIYFPETTTSMNL